MTRAMWKMMACLAVLAFMGMGCAIQTPAPTDWRTAFVPQDLNAGIQSGDYIQKVESFLVIVDASGSMDSRGGSNLDFARNLVSRMNETLPDLSLAGGVRAYGRFSWWPLAETKMYYGMSPYEKAGLHRALEEIPRGRGISPLDQALKAAAQDLEQAQGNMAVLVFSDGVEQDMNYAAAIAAAGSLKEKFGERVCIYTIQIGEDAGGKKLLDQVAAAGVCGAAFQGTDLESPAAMGDFVTQVFLAKAPPKPPKEVPPPPPPVPSDRDGDGIPDDRDKCPDSPRGARVDETGCWVIEPVIFEFDKTIIRSQFHPLLDEIAGVMKQNPGLTMEVEGHTCNMGVPAYNQILSERRAKAVKKYLVEKGIEECAISTKGYGASRPAVSNDTREGRALNRRTTFEPSAR